MEATADLYNQDCISGLHERVADNSVHLTVTSPPFEELFTYSGKPEDVGNNGSSIDIREGRFALNLRFLVEQLYRVTAAGCNACIHCQTLLAYKNQHGFMGRRDFRGALVDIFSAGGFHWTGEFAIRKDPQRAAQSLNLHSLQFKTGYARSSTNLMPWINDYVLVFQKPGEVEVPVLSLKHRTNSGGWLTSEDWIRDAHGIWTDIHEIDVLDGARSKSNKEDKHEKHVCPLQLMVIQRCVQLYTNPVRIQPDVLVLDPFMGIGSTAYATLGGRSPCTSYALPEPRNVVGFELKESYYKASLDNVELARRQQEEKPKDKTLLDMIETAEVAS